MEKSFIYEEIIVANVTAVKHSTLLSNGPMPVLYILIAITKVINVACFVKVDILWSSTFNQIIRSLSFLLTSVCDDSKVGSDNLHVNTMLLLSDENCPPQTSVVASPLVVSLFQTIVRSRFGWCHWCVVWMGTEYRGRLKHPPYFSVTQQVLQHRETSNYWVKSEGVNNIVPWLYLKIYFFMYLNVRHLNDVLKDTVTYLFFLSLSKHNAASRSISLIKK